MVEEYRYIQIEESGRVSCTCDYPVDGVTIDTEGMIVPEMPADAVYELYYNETDGLHWVKIAERKEKTEEPTQLDAIEKTQFIMMEAMADQYEQSLERELVNMEVQATIYEEILAISEKM